MGRQLDGAVDAMEPSVERGLTLTEVLTVTILIGLLAATGIPYLDKMIQRRYREHAQQILQVIHDGEQRHFDKEGVYLALTPTNLQPEWRKIFMDKPDQADAPIAFDVVIAGCGSPGPPECFIATATHNASGQTMTIDQSGLWCGGTPTPDSCATWPYN